MPAYASSFSETRIFSRRCLDEIVQCSPFHRPARRVRFGLDEARQTIDARLLYEPSRASTFTPLESWCLSARPSLSALQEAKMTISAQLLHLLKYQGENESGISKSALPIESRPPTGANPRLKRSGMRHSKQPKQFTVLGRK